MDWSAVPAAEATQTEYDFIFSQVVDLWFVDYRAARFTGRSISIGIVIDPDGFALGAMHRDSPVPVSTFIIDFERLITHPDPGIVEFGYAMESFALAIRRAQPFRLPADPPWTAPRLLQVRMHLGEPFASALPPAPDRSLVR